MRGRMKIPLGLGDGCRMENVSHYFFLSIYFHFVSSTGPARVEVPGSQEMVANGRFDICFRGILSHSL